MAHTASTKGKFTALIRLRARGLFAVVAMAVFVAAGLPGSAGDPEPLKPAGGQKEEKNPKDQKTKDKDEEAPPKCSRCGARTSLVAFCKCEPGTMKKPKVEYDVKCDPICVAGCGEFPCMPAGRKASCCDACSHDCCNAWVRQRKVLKKTTTDEEVDTIKRTVDYVCCRCLEPPGCAAVTSCTEVGKQPRQWYSTAWAWLTEARQ